MGRKANPTCNHDQTKVLMEKLGISGEDWTGSAPGETSITAQVESLEETVALLQKDIEATIKMLDSEGMAVFHSIDDLAAKIIGE